MKATSRPLRPVARWLIGLSATAALGFCLFGLLATFEPLPPEKQWLWRAIYGTAAAGCLAGLWKLAGFRRKNAASHDESMSAQRRP